MIYAGILAFFVLEYVRPSNYFPAMARVNSILPLLVAVAAILAPSRVSNQELFEDRTRLDPMRFLPAAALLAVGVAALSTPPQGACDRTTRTPPPVSGRGRLPPRFAHDRTVRPEPDRGNA